MILFKIFLLLFALYYLSYSQILVDVEIDPEEDDLITPISEQEDIIFTPNHSVMYDPPNGTFTAHAMFLYVFSNTPSMRFYYDLLGGSPTLSSDYVESDTPYIQVKVPFLGTSDRHVVVVGVIQDEEGQLYRTEQFNLTYIVESYERPFSYGHFIPGVESNGYFLQIGMEMVASARAQAAEKQEFADFNTRLGLGTYETQINTIHLPTIDDDLIGFEGGFAYNITKNGETKHYGLLIPYHNTKYYFGKVVIIDLITLRDSNTTCQGDYRIENYDQSTDSIVFSGTNTDLSTTPCVHVINLASKFNQARGFRRGFLGYPYGYLSPGEGSMTVRLDLEDIGIHSTKFIDLSRINPIYGGYSSGFSDGLWSCLVPYRTYTGPVGGIRSSLEVDATNLRPYYSSIMVCLSGNAWSYDFNDEAQLELLKQEIRSIDFSLINEPLRGFSDAVRAGRYAYISPLNNNDRTFTSNLVRIYLGNDNIGTEIDHNLAANGNLRSMINVLDLSRVSTELKGFSSIFSAGKYIFLVPFRNKYEPKNGQRGHGNVVRIDMNNFSIEGIEFLDLASTTRSQIPSFADINLRGFSTGFVSGQYAVLVPFYNAKLNGKVARFLTTEPLDSNLQELDLMIDRFRPNEYKGYRGGFASLWKGVED